MSQLIEKFGVLEVCLPIITGVGLVFAFVINLVFLSPPLEIQDYPESAMVEISLAEA